MTKILFASVLALAACGGGGKKPDTTTSNTDTTTTTTDGSAAGSGSATTGEGVDCAKEIALVCPEGQIDGCLKTPVEGTTHACVAK